MVKVRTGYELRSANKFGFKSPLEQPDFKNSVQPVTDYDKSMEKQLEIYSASIAGNITTTITIPNGIKYSIKNGYIYANNANDANGNIYIEIKPKTSTGYDFWYSKIYGSNIADNADRSLAILSEFTVSGVSHDGDEIYLTKPWEFTEGQSIQISLSNGLPADSYTILLIGTKSIIPREV
jgi:hypothetical protein